MIVICGCMLNAPVLARADMHRAISEQAGTSINEDEVVNYAAAFFQRYRPNTALDMVAEVPGFQLDEGEDKRGFGSAAGNILINDRRPSAKQDTVSAILGRIPAGNVERIEVIRGQVRGIELGGYSVVANVILSETAGPSLRWEAVVEKNLEPQPLSPGASISLTNRWRDTSYNLGLAAHRITYGDVGTDTIFNGSGELTEIRTDDVLTEGPNFNLNLNTVTQVGKSLLQSNIKVGDQSTSGELISLRVPQMPGETATEELFIDDSDTRDFELGLDAERKLNDELAGKAIFLYAEQSDDEVSTQRTIDDTGAQTLFRSAVSDTESTEIIARIELDWTGIASHAVQMNLEGAFNSVDGTLVQTEDTGSGPVDVPVPGGNTRVEENRVDILIRDNWSLGNYELAYGIGAEASRITQTGDAELERDFFFVKPEALLTYSAGQGPQTRFRVAREVSQLNFDDFISATVFEDDDLALGNPNLEPESTWVAELSHERRFGDFSVVTITAFYNWISEVEDLLPLSTTFEAPGNIGDGRRWGLEFEGTLPLDRIGLTDARLDIKARWQDSTVTDPVTGQSRVLSSKQESGPPDDNAYLRNETDYALALDFRQDFEASRVAWGWTTQTRTGRPFYKVNELDVRDESVEVNAFVETTRWWGLKVRFEINRLFDLDETRDRTLYEGERELTPVERLIYRSRDGGRELGLRLSGTF